MTYEPPAPPPPPPPPPPAGPPPGMPPTPPPPPSGGYGGPTPSGGGFNAQSVNPLDWAIVAAGLLTFIFSFVSYYSYTVKVSEAGFHASASGSVNAWHGFFGWFGMLLAVIGSAALAISLFAPQVNLPLPARLTCLFAYLLAALCLILALFVIPGDTRGINAFGVHVDKGHGVGYWLSLIVVLAGAVLSLMRAQATGTAMPGPLSKMPKIGR